MEALHRIRGLLAKWQAPEDEPEFIDPTWQDRLWDLARMAAIYLSILGVGLLAYRLILPARPDYLCVQLVQYAAGFIALGAWMFFGALWYLWIGWQAWNRQVFPQPGSRLLFRTPIRRGAQARVTAAMHFLVGASLLALIAWLLATEPALWTLAAPCAPA